MKNIHLIWVFLFVTTSYSQVHPVLRTITAEQTYGEEFDLKSGDYIKDVNNRLNHYVGTWQYNKGNGTILTLKLQKILKKKSISPNGEYEYFDKIITTYKLVKNGVVLVDNLNIAIPAPTGFSALSRDDSMKYGQFYHGSSPDYIDGIISDISLGINTYAEIELLLTTVNEPRKIKFSMYGNNSRRIHPDSFYEGKPTFEIPNFITLTKIN